MPFWILIEADVSLLLCEYGVVTPHVAVLTREPVRATLAKYNVTGNDELRGSLLGAESLARALGGLIGAAF